MGSLVETFAFLEVLTVLAAALLASAAAPADGLFLAGASDGSFFFGVVLFFTGVSFLFGVGGLDGAVEAFGDATSLFFGVLVSSVGFCFFGAGRLSCSFFTRAAFCRTEKETERSDFFKDRY